MLVLSPGETYIRHEPPLPSQAGPLPSIQYARQLQEPIMQQSPHSHRVVINLAKIRDNYRHLYNAAEYSGAESIAPVILPAGPESAGPLRRDRELHWPRLIPVVKADAYGHGHTSICRALQREGANLFASGSVSESAALRQELLEHAESGDGPLPEIIALLGIMDENDVRLAYENAIIPVIHCFEQLALLGKTKSLLPVVLKCNSGMNRLGFSTEDIPELLHALARMPHVRPVLAISHLASADTEQGKQAAHSQASVFAAMLETLRRAFPALAASLGNTAGTLLSSEIEAAMGPHICRPGIGLYGGNPFTNTSLEPLGAKISPAMSVSAPIIAVRELGTGCGIGYGHTFRATKNMRVGIVAAGYADMFPRSMSNHGVLCVKGGRAPVIGRVSMQMIAIDLESGMDAKPGDEAWLLGGPYDRALTVEELASLWGSISYEVFCLLGHGHRVYEDS